MHPYISLPKLTSYSTFFYLLPLSTYSSLPSLPVPKTSSLQVAKLGRGFGPDGLDSLWSCCGHVALSSNNLFICLSSASFFEFITFSLQSAHNCLHYNCLLRYMCGLMHWILYFTMSLRLQTVYP